MRLSLSIMALLALAGCGEEKQEAAAPATTGRQQAARDVAHAALRARLQGRETQLRGVQVFSQALGDTVAVCGRSSAGAGDPYIPYVAVVNFAGEAPRVSAFTLAASGAEATRVFLEMVDRCFDGGGPLTNRPMARSFPPLPAALPIETPRAAPPPAAPEAAPPPAAPPIETGGLPPSRQSVTTWSRTGANLRSAPVGGEVIGVVPPATTLEVLAEAPGGWFQVGRDGAVVGWIHASVLDTVR